MANINFPNLKQHQDKNGRVRVLLCAVCLFVNYGLRDFIITALPGLSISGKHDSANITGSTTDRMTLYEFTARPIKYISDGPSEKETRLESNTSYQLNESEGWNPYTIGLSVGATHWGTTIALIITPFLLARFSLRALMCWCLYFTGFLSLFAQVCANSGGWALVIIRFFQGLSQGYLFPFVYIILLDLELPCFTAAYSAVFLAPWVGSSIGMLIGSSSVPFLANYILGCLAMALILLVLKLPVESDFVMAEHNAWRESLESKAVWSCIALQSVTIYSVHTFLVGLSFAMNYKLGVHTLWWTLSLVTLLSGIISRLFAVIPLRIINTSLLSALNRRRMLISSGSIITIVFLSLCGTIGLESESGLVMCAFLGISIGTNIMALGVRMSLHDLAPILPIPLLHLSNIGGSFGAGLAALLFPALTLQSEFWSAAWILPVVLVTMATVVYLLFVSVNPLSHQLVISFNGSNTSATENTEATDIDKDKANNIVNGVSAAPTQSTDIDAKSFKSFYSSKTFKTITSSKHRSGSFVTAAGDTEADMKSIAGTEAGVCKSIVDDSLVELHSIKSDDPSFQSANQSKLVQMELVLSADELDRTSAWLSQHHGANPEHHKRNTVIRLRAQRNMLLAMEW